MVPFKRVKKVNLKGGNMKRIGQVEFSRHKVILMEYERGWGSKIDEIIYFENELYAKTFVIDFNLENDKDSVPDWYMTAEYQFIG